MSLDLDDLYVDPSVGFAETVTLAGVSKTGIFDQASALVIEDIVSTVPTFVARTADIPAAAAGQTLVRSAVNYKVREVHQVPPDGILTRLVLARA